MILILSLLLQVAHAVYLPGVAPHSYAAGDMVDLKVNKLRYTTLQAKILYQAL